MRAQKEVRNMVEKACIILDNRYIIINRMFVKMGTFKPLLVRTQNEMRYMLLETEGKALLGT